jgi:hypothetical protein
MTDENRQKQARQQTTVAHRKYGHGPRRRGIRHSPTTGEPLAGMTWRKEGPSPTRPQENLAGKYRQGRKGLTNGDQPCHQRAKRTGMHRPRGHNPRATPRRTLKHKRSVQTETYCATSEPKRTGMHQPRGYNPRATPQRTLRHKRSGRHRHRPSNNHGVTRVRGI